MTLRTAKRRRRNVQWWAAEMRRLEALCERMTRYAYALRAAETWVKSLPVVMPHQGIYGTAGA